MRSKVLGIYREYLNAACPVMGNVYFSHFCEIFFRL